MGYDPVSTKQVTVYVDMKSNNGEQVIIPLKIGGVANIGDIESNTLKITTVFSPDGNNGKNLLESAIKKDSDQKRTLFYLDTKKALESGVAPDILTIENLTDSRLYQNITSPGSSVNIDVPFWGKGKQFNKWFKDSKVVNDDDSPRIVYHFSDSDTRFSVFKPGERGEVWFSSIEEPSYNKRPQLYKEYLRIVNPYEKTYYVGSDSKFDPQAVAENGRRGDHDGAMRLISYQTQFS